MRNEIQYFYRLNNRNSFDTYHSKQKKPNNNNYTIKQDFKSSVGQWRCNKKVDKLISSLQNKM